MPLPRTPEALALIEHAIISAHGDLNNACRDPLIQCSPYDLHQWVQSDPEVASRVHHAQLLGWTALESEAIRRATGYEKEVWYQGVMVGTETVYSDGLLSQLLKARVPGHNTDAARSHTALAVQVNVMPRASTYEEWAAQRQQQLTHSQDDPVVPPSEQVIDAEYSEVAKDAYVLMRDPDNALPDWL